MSEQSEFQRTSSRDTDLKAFCRILCDLVTSCRGPEGKIKLIQNMTGGHLTVTSSSLRLFSAMSFSTAAGTFLKSIVQGHLENFSDGGLFVCHFSLNLLITSLDLPLNKQLLIKMYETFLCLIDEHAFSEKCVCRFRVNIGDVSQMSKFVESIIGSKPFCCLQRECLQKFSRLVLKTFLLSVPEKTDSMYFSDRVYILRFPNNEVDKSECLKGILIECPSPSSLPKPGIQTIISPNGVPKICVVLVKASMSGDMEEILDAGYEVDGLLDVNFASVSKVLELCSGLVNRGVGLFLFQKVLHPKVKAFLQEAGVAFIDRMGAGVMAYIQDLTGAVPVTSVMGLESCEQVQCGWVDSATHSVKCGRHFLHLVNDQNPVVSLLLADIEEERLSELKAVCMSALSSLKTLLCSPVVLCGGGCWENHIAAVLPDLVKERSEDLVFKLDCTPAQLFSCTENFASCLKKVSVRNNRNIKQSFSNNYTTKYASSHNHWHSRSIHCYSDLDASQGCTDDSSHDADTPTDSFPQVMDSLVVAMKSLKTAVLTANKLLGIGNYLKDGHLNM